MNGLSILLTAMLGGLPGAVAVSDESLPQKNLTLHGWIPTWRFSSGTAEVVTHETMFSSVSPFSYEVATSGKIIGTLPIKTRSWSNLASSSIKENFLIVPTIAWFDGEAMGQILSGTSTRKGHVDNIVSLVVANKYKGIDLDYENRKSIYNESYKTFIRELSARLHKEQKVLYCTAEARTPLEDERNGVSLASRTSKPSTYKTLNENCDQIRIMSYDQRDYDIALTSLNDDVFYRPVADSAWVEKTLQEALYEIDRKKLVLGIPNYGNIYMATSSNGRTRYKYVGAINEDQAKQRAQNYKLRPARNTAGELQYTYRKDNIKYWVSFSDSVALRKKIELAEKFGIEGISIFKFDGTMDGDDWIVLSKYIKDNKTASGY
jgi:spore germination protein YaaH